MQKTLAAKLASFKQSPSNRSFIIADAKDADMAFGIAAPGKNSEGRYRSLIDFRDQIREIVDQGLVDIMLMSASTSEVLAIQERIFDSSTVTPRFARTTRPTSMSFADRLIQKLHRDLSPRPLSITSRWAGLCVSVNPRRRM